MAPPAARPLGVRRLGRTLAQCGLGTLAMALVLVGLSALLHAAIAASLGASTCILFATPRSAVARARTTWGGYLWGALCGGTCALAADALSLGARLPTEALSLLADALAVGLTILAMLVTRTVPPPAAGLALALAIEPFDWRAIALALGAILLLTLIKELLGPHLEDLGGDMPGSLGRGVNRQRKGK